MLTSSKLKGIIKPSNQEQLETIEGQGMNGPAFRDQPKTSILKTCAIRFGETAMNVFKNSVAVKVKAVLGLFSLASSTAQSSALFVTQSAHPRAPALGGHLGGVKVSVFVRRPADTSKSAFLSFVGNDGAQVATGNIRVRCDGKPVVKVVMTNKSEHWIRVSKNVSDAMLEKLGANMEKLHTKTAKAFFEAVAA